jgi:hypothetical protein
MALTLLERVSAVSESNVWERIIAVCIFNWVFVTDDLPLFHYIMKFWKMPSPMIDH